MTKHTGPRLVNPDDRPVPKETIPYKTILVTTILSGTAGFVLAKLLDHVWETGKKNNPFGKSNTMLNPMGQMGPMQMGPMQMGPMQMGPMQMGPMGQGAPAPQYPQAQGLPFSPPTAPPPQVTDDTPPKWAQAFIAAHEQRLSKLEKRGKGPRVVSRDDDDDDAAA